MSACTPKPISPTTAPIRDEPTNSPIALGPQPMAGTGAKIAGW